MPDDQPTNLYNGLKIVFLCPLSCIPSSMIKLKIVNSSVYLSFRSNYRPIISAIEPGTFLQYLNILYEKEEPSLPIWPKFLFLHTSIWWSYAALQRPLCLIKGGTGVCLSKKCFASIQALFP